MQKTTGLHTFHVNAQNPSSSHNLAIPSQKPTFHTISPQSFRGDATKIKSNTTAAGKQRLAPQSNYGDSIRFASPKTTQGFTHRQEKNTLPPKKRIRTSRYPKESPNATFSVRKPVSTALPTDAWALILTRCDVKFLVAARLVCRAFHEILSKETIWREVRESTYPGRPSCPPGLTEMQYANLLSERGCQIRPCTRDNTRKVYWPFMLRMCEQCYVSKTQMIENTSPEATAYTRLYQLHMGDDTADLPTSLAGLLPCGDSWSGRYSGCRHLDFQNRRWSLAWGKFCVMSDSYEKLKLEFTEAQMAENFNFIAWARRKWKHTRDIMNKAIALDTFVDDSTSQSDLRQQKIKFFRQKASELNPPMRWRVLEKMAAYRGAIETSNKASLRSWDVLRPKIDLPELRDQAERLLTWEDYFGEPDDTALPDNVWDRLISHREARVEQPRSYKEEQEVVIQIARQKFQDLVDKVHDEDVLLLFLNAVRRTYEDLEEKPEGFNGDGTRGVYRLTLDDARMVIEDAEETCSSRGTMRQRAIFGSLKCIACCRVDYNKSFEFEELIRHIRRVHCKYIGIDLQYHRIAAPLDILPTSCFRYLDPVPWYHIPWPKSLPALPKHRKGDCGMIWNPDEEVEYLRHPDENVSIFNDRVVSNEPETDPTDQRANFCQAMRTLAGTRLEAPAMVQIALEYARQRAESSGSDSSGISGMRLSVQDFQQLEHVIHDILPTLKLRFLCGMCMKGSTSSSHARYTRYSLGLSKLVEHWEDKHDVELDSPIQDLLCLPSDGELRQIIENEDAKLRMEKGKITARAKSGSNQPPNKLDPRVQALLNVPSCMDKFTQLFPLTASNQHQPSRT